ncbi:MAG: cytochrome c biogenesis protein CcdA [Patescibacteria group bacterium]
MEVTALIIPSFIAGLLTFLAPCTLPLVPGYLGFISGVSLVDLNDPLQARAARWKIFLNGLFFTIGFTSIFIMFGAAFGLIGSVLVPYRLWLGRIGGVFVILFGLFMLDVIKIPWLSGERRFAAPALFARGRMLNSFILGAAFGFGWTPCIGPILGSVLFLASFSATALSGAFLLGVFSLGLAVPFLLIAVGIGHAGQHLGSLGRYLKIISVMGGLFLIFLGGLLATNNLGVWVAYFYQIFGFINYDKLLDYL